ATRSLTRLCPAPARRRTNREVAGVSSRRLDCARVRSAVVRTWLRSSCSILGLQCAHSASGRTIRAWYCRYLGIDGHREDRRRFGSERRESAASWPMQGGVFRKASEASARRGFFFCPLSPRARERVGVRGNPQNSSRKIAKK